MSDLKRLSKTLALWLRHRPDAAGLALDAGGWAEVEAVLTALSRRRISGGRAALLEMVAANDKQRFELSPDGQRIRARQGHSIEVEGDWRPAEPPEHLYHGTVEAALPSIMAEGLRPMRRHHVHLSPDVATAIKVGGRRGQPVVLTVLAGEMSRAGHGFFVTGNGVWLTDRVPPACLHR